MEVLLDSEPDRCLGDMPGFGDLLGVVDAGSPRVGEPDGRRFGRATWPAPGDIDSWVWARMAPDGSPAPLLTCYASPEALLELPYQVGLLEQGHAPPPSSETR